MQGSRMLAIFSVVTLTIAIVCANVAKLLIARAVWFHPRIRCFPNRESQSRSIDATVLQYPGLSVW
jgi:hypothetical protein